MQLYTHCSDTHWHRYQVPVSGQIAVELFGINQGQPQFTKNCRFGNPFLTFVPSPLNQNIFLEDILKKKNIFLPAIIRKQLLVFPNSKLADSRTAKGKSISPALTIHPDPRQPPPYDLTIPQGLPPPHSNSYFPPDLLLPLAARNFSTFPTGTAAFLPLEMFYLLPTFPICRTTGHACFLFSNIIFFPEFLSNPKFSQGRTALSKIKKIQV